MMDFKKNKLAAAMAGLLTLGGLGVGVAAAANGSATAPAAQVQPSSPVTTPAGTPAEDATTAPGEVTPEPAGADTDTLQEGDQTTPDTTGGASEVGDGNEANEKEGTEQAGVEEPGDANLPGGGHADPEGQNVDHQFEGVE